MKRIPGALRFRLPVLVLKNSIGLARVLGVISSRCGSSSRNKLLDDRRIRSGTLIDDECGYVVWEDYASTFRLTIGPGGAVECR